MKKTEILAYTAGIIDGEGYITILSLRPHSRIPKNVVGVNHTNEWLCRWLQMQFGGTLSSAKPHKANWKPSYRWELRNAKAAEFLRLIYPYLQLKRAQANIAIGFEKRKGKYCVFNDEVAVLNEADRIRIQTLNKRGVDVPPVS